MAIKAAAGAALAAAATRSVGAATAAAAGSAPALDLDTPAGKVQAYLKLRSSIDTRDVYYWFSGRLDVAVAGEPIRPIVDVEQLILRRTEKIGDLAWTVTDWEASFYRDINTGEVIDGEIENPATGEKVRPLPYTEGPVRFRFTDQEPRIIGSRDVLPKTGKPFDYPHRIVGNDFIMTKSSYIDVPNFLSEAEYPAESSGPRLYVTSQSILTAKVADIMNPDVASAPTTFAYTAASSWLPWMRMGQRPGHVIWAEAGRKLFSLDEAPAEQIDVLRRVHPQWFHRPEPWPDFTNMYLRYKGLHPAAKA